MISRVSDVRRGEAGQLTVMIIGYALLAALAVAVIVNASNAFLERRSLASWADGAALAAVQAVDHGRLYRGGAEGSLPLSDDGARAAVLDYVGRHGLADRFDRFRVDAVLVDHAGGRVTVRMSASVPIVLIADMGAASVSADASATAPLSP